MQLSHALSLSHRNEEPETIIPSIAPVSPKNTAAHPPFMVQFLVEWSPFDCNPGGSLYTFLNRPEI